MKMPPNDPGNRADALYALISIDPKGDEGIVAHIVGDHYMALVTTRWSLVERFFRPAAQQLIATLDPGCRLVLRKYDNATDLETFSK